MISTFEYLVHLAANPRPVNNNNNNNSHKADKNSQFERASRERTASTDRYARSTVERALTRVFDASYEATISVDEATSPVVAVRDSATGEEVARLPLGAFSRNIRRWMRDHREDERLIEAYGSDDESGPRDLAVRNELACHELRESLPLLWTRTEKRDRRKRNDGRYDGYRR